MNEARAKHFLEIVREEFVKKGLKINTYPLISWEKLERPSKRTTVDEGAIPHDVYKIPYVQIVFNAGNPPCHCFGLVSSLNVPLNLEHTHGSYRIYQGTVGPYAGTDRVYFAEGRTKLEAFFNPFGPQEGFVYNRDLILKTFEDFAKWRVGLCDSYWKKNLLTRDEAIGKCDKRLLQRLSEIRDKRRLRDAVRFLLDTEIECEFLGGKHTLKVGT